MVRGEIDEIAIFRGNLLNVKRLVIALLDVELKRSYFNKFL